jgi:hypothetical protein
MEQLAVITYFPNYSKSVEKQFSRFLFNLLNLNTLFAMLCIFPEFV